MRVIARLDIKGANVVKGVQFECLRVMGKPAEMAQEYFLQGADELVYIDTVASLYKRDSLLDIVREASEHIHIPFMVGGGVRTIDDIRDLLQAGADKVAINTAAVKRPELIREAAMMFGAQCIVVSIEAKRNGNEWEVYIDNGREKTGLDAVEWAVRAEKLGAGEILLTSVDNEGTQKGLDAELIKAVASKVSIPVIAAGGASSPKEVAKTIRSGGAEAVAVASILHYGKTTIAEIKDALVSERAEDLRTVTSAQRERKPVARIEQDIANYNRFTLRQFKDSTLHVDAPAMPKEVAVDVDPATADVCIVNYELNNVRSIVTAFEGLGKKAAIVQTPEAIRVAKRLMLPGVGAFAGGMDALREHGLIEPILERARAGVPILGICLGMQLLFDESEEFGNHKGLGLVPGKVVAFPDPRVVNLRGYKVPHVGWSNLEYPIGVESWRGSVLRDAKPGDSVYFAHSFFAQPKDVADVLAVSMYGAQLFCAAIKHNNISATQFHPEKSSEVGLNMLRAFCDEPVVTVV